MQLNVKQIAWLVLGMSPLDFTERFLNELVYWFKLKVNNIDCVSRYYFYPSKQNNSA